MTSHYLCLIDIRHSIGLSRVCECGWCLKLKHLELLHKGGDRHYSLLELVVLVLHSMLKVDDHVGVSVHLIMGTI
jgi:hypothetical protein